MNSVGDYIVRGGWVMWPILALSVVALGIALQRWRCILEAGAENRESTRTILNLIEKGDFSSAAEKTKGASGTCSILLTEFLVCRTSRTWERRVVHSGSAALRELERRIQWLAVISNAATLIGLYGTVLGMVEVFRGVEASAGTPDPGALAGGIWMALLTTVGGLTVAIPTMLAYHYLLSRIDKIEARMKEIVESLHVITES